MCDRSARRCLSGYAAKAVWGAREVLRAVGDALPDETLGRLERSLLHLRHPTDEKLAGARVHAPDGAA